MMIAALDASTTTASAALVELKRGQIRVLGSRSERWIEVADVAPVALLASVVERARLTLCQVDAFAVGLGPGEAIGLEDAVRALRALALANQRPFRGISSLEALAHAARAQAEPGATLLPLVASGDHFFVGYYRVAAVGPPRAIRPEQKLGASELHRVGRLDARSLRVGAAWAASASPGSRVVTRGCALPEGAHVAAAVARDLGAYSRGHDLRSAYQVRPRRVVLDGHQGK